MEFLITALTYPAYLIIKIAVHLIGEPDKRMIKRTLED